MKFEHLEINNKYMHMEPQNIDLGCTGIYLITGPNGSGKSTMVKEIVFGKHLSVQNTPKQQKAYEQNRASLISYVPQEIPNPDSSVLDYVKKDNAALTEAELLSYMERFGLGGTSLQLNVQKLSGGERVKLCIISALLKKTPYIFLDEPTNNLDDGSAAELCNILLSASENRTVVLVTHDPRVSIPGAHRVEVSTKGVSQAKVSAARNACPPAPVKNASGVRLGLKLQKKKWNICMLLVFVLVLAAAAGFNFLWFLQSYSVMQKPESGAVLLYTADQTYSQLNQIYAKGAGLTIEESNYDTFLRYEDVPSLAGIEGIEEIYLWDQPEYDAFSTAFNDEESEETIYIMVPDAVYNSVLDPSGLLDILVLNEGTAPEDGKKEAAMSADMLSELFGIEDAEEALGTALEINGESYTLVGIMPWDLIWLSYDAAVQEDETVYSFYYQYTEEDYDAFRTETMAYLQEIEFYLPYGPESLLLLTDEDAEKDVLDAVMTMWPANNYYSAVFEKIAVKASNSTFLRNMLLINLLFALAGAVVLILNSRMVVEEDLVQLEDYRVYYLLDDVIRRNYLLTRSAVKLILLLLICVLDAVLTGVYAMSAAVLAVTGAVMILADYLAAWLKDRQLKKAARH